MSGAVAHIDRYKQGYFFSREFVGDNSWNGHENNCLFANVGGGQFVDVARPLGADSVKDGRGVAVADFDSDGRLDLVIGNNGETPTLYLNAVKGSGRAVELKLVGTRGNRDAVGAWVRLTAGGKTMTRHVEAGSGYASQSMLPVHFGLGGAEHVEAVEIRWPGGSVERIEGARLGDPSRGRLFARVVEGGVAPGTLAAGPAR